MLYQPVCPFPVVFDQNNDTARQSLLADGSCGPYAGSPATNSYLFRDIAAYRQNKAWTQYNETLQSSASVRSLYCIGRCLLAHSLEPECYVAVFLQDLHQLR